MRQRAMLGRDGGGYGRPGWPGASSRAPRALGGTTCCAIAGGEILGGGTGRSLEAWLPPRSSAPP
eukprot:534249-Prymnesium_polylepis.1